MCKKKGDARYIFRIQTYFDLTYFKTRDRFSKYAFKSRDVTIKGEIFICFINLTMHSYRNNLRSYTRKE